MMTISPADPDGDAALVRSWLAHPKAAFWAMGGLSVPEVAAYLRTVEAFLGRADAVPAFLLERYDPCDLLGPVFPLQEGDVGMHVLVAPSGTPVHGFTRRVFDAVMTFLFADPAVRRVVVEPDERNTAVHALNRWAGFVEHGVVALPDKKALVSTCTRAQFAERAA